MKRHILAWMAVFIVMFVPLWWTTTRVYRASLPFEEMNSQRHIKCKVGIELQFPPAMKDLQKEVHQKLESAELDFSFGNSTNNYIFNIECGKYSNYKVLVTSARKVSIFIPDSECTIENARDIVSDTILDLFDSKVAENDSINMLKFSETYQVTWSLLNGDPRDSFLSWDVSQAVSGIICWNVMLRLFYSTANRYTSSCLDGIQFSSIFSFFIIRFKIMHNSQ